MVYIGWCLVALWSNWLGLATLNRAIRVQIPIKPGGVMV